MYRVAKTIGLIYGNKNIITLIILSQAIFNQLVLRLSSYTIHQQIVIGYA